MQESNNPNSNSGNRTQVVELYNNQDFEKVKKKIQEKSNIKEKERYLIFPNPSSSSSNNNNNNENKNKTFEDENPSSKNYKKENNNENNNENNTVLNQPSQELELIQLEINNSKNEKQEFQNYNNSSITTTTPILNLNESNKNTKKNKKSESKTKNPSNKRGSYTKRSCINCKLSHAACDEGRPCKRCVKLGIENCTDSERKTRKKTKTLYQNTIPLSSKIDVLPSLFDYIPMIDNLKLPSQESQEESIIQLPPININNNNDQIIIEDEQQQEIVQELHLDNNLSNPPLDLIQLDNDEVLKFLGLINDSNNNNSSAFGGDLLAAAGENDNQILISKDAPLVPEILANLLPENSVLINNIDNNSSSFNNNENILLELFNDSSNNNNNENTITNIVNTVNTNENFEINGDIFDLVPHENEFEQENTNQTTVAVLIHNNNEFIQRILLENARKDQEIEQLKNTVKNLENLKFPLEFL